jgi:transcriptional antiterminator RfaH
MALMVSDSNLKWYPVYTQPRAEKKAYSALIDKGIEAYLPLHRRLKQWSDRKKWVEEPLISSYLFVRIADNDSDRGIDDQRGRPFFIFFGQDHRDAR